MSLPLTSDRRRRLAAVVLRGDLAAYDATPKFRVTVDRLIDELLRSAGPSFPADSWDLLADRVIARFAHRLPQAQTAEPSAAREVNGAACLPA